MTKVKTSEEVLITLRLSRHAKPEELTPPVHSQAAISLLRGRVTRQETVLAIRIEGSTLEIRKALDYWESHEFKVEKVQRNGAQDPLSDSWNRINPPSLPGCGSSSKSSRNPFVLRKPTRIEKRCF